MELKIELIDKAKQILKSKEFARLIKENIKNENKNSQENETEELFTLHKDNGVEIDDSLCREFVSYCLEYLKLKDSSDLTVVLSEDKEKFKTFAFYSIGEHLVAVYALERHTLDIFRSLAHELVHYKQDLHSEITPDEMGDENDGVKIEDEANAVAGVIMRKFTRLHPNLR